MVGEWVERWLFHSFLSIATPIFGILVEYSVVDVMKKDKEIENQMRMMKVHKIKRNNGHGGEIEIEIEHVDMIGRHEGGH